MKTMSEILDHLEELDAMIVRPATDKDIKRCKKDFKNIDCTVPLPDGYIWFLKQLNGFAWNGIEFFSTDQVTDPETDYTLNDIVTANEGFAEQNGDFLEIKNYMLLGRADDDLYVYNAANGHYEVLDMTGRDVMEDFDSFEAMFVGVVVPRI
jgi:hypothetical protein